MFAVKSLLRQVTPPVLWSVVERVYPRWRNGGIRFTGHYQTWSDAQANSQGYDDALILSKVRDACLQVKAGTAVFERDSVPFDRQEFVWPVLACLNLAAARNRGRLNVVDFGGSLGSFYYQHRPFLDVLDTAWTVVEQPHYVAAGIKDFTTSRLKFSTTIGTDIEQFDHTLLLSSVLHYLPDPTQTLHEILSRRWAMVIVDRTPFLPDRESDRLTIQTVPSSIYKATYPAWFFARKRFMKLFEKDYICLSSWPSLDRYILDKYCVTTEGHCFIRKVF